MSFRRSALWLLPIVIFGASATAVWILRQPLQQSIAFIVNEAKPETTIRFAVIGDNHGATAVYRQALAEISKTDASFVLNLADLTEDGTRREFSDVRKLEQEFPLIVYHTVGSHDIKTDDSRRLYTELTGHQPNYSFDFGRLHIIILDNAARQVGFSQATLDWLAGDLAKYRDKTIILAYHRPFDLPFAAVTGDDETPASRASNKKFTDLISQYNIAYIFNAHIHTYLQYSVGPVPAVISGGGGDPAQSVLGGPGANYFHYLVVTVTVQRVTIEVKRLQISN